MTPRTMWTTRACRIAFLSGALAACHSPRSEKVTNLTASTSPAPAATTAALTGIDLPNATNALPLLADYVPIISVMGDKIRCDGDLVGDAAAIVSAGRLQRVDGLWESLKHARESWKNAHPGAPFPGIALFAFDRHVSAIVFKSVFQTAAFAGYPNGQFAVRASSGTTARVNVDAIVPTPNAAPPAGDRLLVVVRPSKYQLVWRSDDAVLSKDDVTSAGDLPDTVRKEFMKNSTHQTTSDSVIDQAVLYVSDDVDYAGVVAVIDAIDGTTRELASGGTTTRVPALNVTLGIAKDIPNGDPLVSGGRIKPELVRQAVRQDADRFRACYTKGLARNKSLEGTVRIHFVIRRDGTVSDVGDSESTLPDATVIKCIAHEFGKMTFPKPEDGTASVVYPLVFKPGD